MFIWIVWVHMCSYQCMLGQVQKLFTISWLITVVTRKVKKVFRLLLYGTCSETVILVQQDSHNLEKKKKKKTKSTAFIKQRGNTCMQKLWRCYSSVKLNLLNDDIAYFGGIWHSLNKLFSCTPKKKKVYILLPLILLYCSGYTSCIIIV